jgi:hypothetical protein
MPSKTTRRGLALAFLTVAFAIGSTTAAQGAAVTTTPQLPQAGASAINLISPIKDLLSGRAWLMAEGLDPALQGVPGLNSLTRRDVQGAGGPLAAAAQGGAMLQAPGAAALVPFRDPGPAFSRDVLVTRDFGTTPVQTEPHLAVNPRDPQHLVLGVIDYSFPSTSAYVSFDGGENWEGPNQVPYLLGDRVAGGDPVLAFDRRGNVYYAHISIGLEEFSVGPVTVFSMVSSMAVAISEDGGFEWPRTISTARSRVSTENLAPDQFGRLRGTIDVGFLDKPWLAAGRHPTDPTRDVLYLTYTDFEIRYEVFWIGEIPTTLPREMRTTIRMVSSEDGGLTWSDPIAVSPTVRRGYGEREGGGGGPGVFGSLRVVQGSHVAVGPDGVVYVAWFDSTDDDSMMGVGEIWLARSSDGGRSFRPATVAATFNEVDFRPRNAFFRYWASSFPQLAVGPESEVYIVYVSRPSDKLHDDGDVYVVRSRDRGDTWSRPRRLNDDDGAALQFFPSVDVGPDGVVHVMWADMRDDPARTRYHIYYTRSEDRGESWGFEQEGLGFRVGDTRVSDFASNPNRGFPFGLFLGDYFSLKATADDVYMVWADTRLGEFGGFNQKVGFARRSAMASPEVFLSPPAGPGGQEVTIQGFDFQPDLNVFVLLGDSTIAFGRTNADGRFTSRLYMPVTSEGAHTLRVVDASGNIAGTSFYTEFGFGNIEGLIRDVGRQLQEFRDATPVPAGAEAPPAAPSLPTLSFAGVVGAPLLLLGVAALVALGARRRRRDEA